MGCKQTWSGRASQAVGSLAQTANSTDEYLRFLIYTKNIGKVGYFITKGQKWAFMDIVQDLWGKTATLGIGLIYGQTFHSSAVDLSDAL